MPRFINPFTDFGFKKIFGQEVNKDLLMDFLNNLLVGERHILDIEFMDKEHGGASANDRTLIYDIYCRTDTGEYIIVEMQNRKQDNFIDRMLFYTSRSISEQGEKGPDWDYQIKAVYGVAFMNFKVGILKDFRTDAIIADKRNGEMLSDKLRMIFLQLPLFSKKEPDECTNDFERWIYVLNNMETLDRMPYAAKNAVFQRLASISSLAELSREERRDYDHALKVYRDIYTFETEAKRHLDEALKKGREEGLAEGRAKGLAEGLAEGRAEGRAEGKMEGIEQGKTLMAKKMREQGLSVDVISTCTGFSLDYLEKLFSEKE